MTTHGEIQKARGTVVLIGSSYFQGRDRIDLREWVEHRIGDPDSRQPTKSGVSLPITDLPAILAALGRVEQEAIRSGLLSARQYREAGMEPPAELRLSVAS